MNDRRNASFLEKVYDVLVELGKANESDRNSFIYHHCNGCDEWRFQGVFGYGGKYRIQTNSVDYYSENHTKELNELKELIDNQLKQLISEK